MDQGKTLARRAKKVHCCIHCMERMHLLSSVDALKCTSEKLIPATGARGAVQRSTVATTGRPDQMLNTPAIALSFLTVLHDGPFVPHGASQFPVLGPPASRPIRFLLLFCLVSLLAASFFASSSPLLALIAYSLSTSACPRYSSSLVPLPHFTLPHSRCLPNSSPPRRPPSHPEQRR